MEKNNFAILSLVGIVAIVGILVMFLTGFTYGVANQVNEESLAGEASRLATIQSFNVQDDFVLDQPFANIKDLSLAEQSELIDHLANALSIWFPEFMNDNFNDSTVLGLLSSLSYKQQLEFNYYLSSHPTAQGRFFQFDSTGFDHQLVVRDNTKVGGLIAVGIGLLIVGFGGWRCCRKDKPCCEKVGLA